MCHCGTLVRWYSERTTRRWRTAKWEQGMMILEPPSTAAHGQLNGAHDQKYTNIITSSATSHTGTRMSSRNGRPLTPSPIHHHHEDVDTSRFHDMPMHLIHCSGQSVPCTFECCLRAPWQKGPGSIAPPVEFSSRSLKHFSFSTTFSVDGVHSRRLHYVARFHMPGIELNLAVLGRHRLEAISALSAVIPSRKTPVENGQNYRLGVLLPFNIQRPESKMKYQFSGFYAAFLSFSCGSLAAPYVSEPQTTFSELPSTTVSAIPHTNVTSHGPYKGTPTTIGALSTKVLAPSIPARPPAPDAYKYPADGKLHGDQPAPYTPSGGIGTNGSAPVYRVNSDFDYQSLSLALYHEWIELDLFHWGLARFPESEFKANRLTAEDRFLLQFMADQEIGHATVLSNMLGPQAPRQCTYNYPVTNLREYLDFSQKLTRWSEAGVYGFLPHLNSGPAAQILLQSITTEARQQMIFRQFSGLFPMPVWFMVGVPQSWAWTMLAPYISSCPYNQTRLIWQNFPALHVLNQPNPARINGSDVWNETTTGWSNTLSTKDIAPSDLCVNATTVGESCAPGITRNRTQPLSYPGRQVFLKWDEPGRPVGPNNSYITATNAETPRFAAWVTQLNVTYSPLKDVDLSHRTAYTIQPNVSTIEGDPAINGTMFLALTDTDLFVTPYNLTQINPHVAALAIVCNILLGLLAFFFGHPPSELYGFLRLAATTLIGLFSHLSFYNQGNTK
ncbi:hypothetical protein ACRALDRAFT_206194 [Sodiomyces alcalophilus JCM 7366]|uniref:uncharacterized protein n=1 Tax=Sodiomyces alcalophilus JCM 7366 TaxID=591952 RepID=UPI0039B5A5AF